MRTVLLNTYLFTHSYSVYKQIEIRLKDDSENNGVEDFMGQYNFTIHQKGDAQIFTIF